VIQWRRRDHIPSHIGIHESWSILTLHYGVSRSVTRQKKEAKHGDGVEHVVTVTEVVCMILQWVQDDDIGLTQ